MGYWIRPDRPAHLDPGLPRSLSCPVLSHPEPNPVLSLNSNKHKPAGDPRLDSWQDPIERQHRGWGSYLACSKSRFNLQPIWFPEHSGYKLLKNSKQIGDARKLGPGPQEARLLRSEKPL